MTILTNLPVNLILDDAVVVTLDKAQLIADFGIVDPYWSDSANWVNVRFLYGSDTVDQKTKLVFAGNDAPLYLPSNAYVGNWLCSKILIWDGLERQYILNRADFPVATEFDFNVIASAVTATYNSLQKGGLIVLSNADLTATQPTSSGGPNQQCYMTPSFPSASGKKYLELLVNANPLSNQLIVGGSISNAAPVLFEGQSSQFGFATEFYFRDDGNSFINLGSYGGASITFTVADVLMMAIDLDNNKIWLGKNGAWFAGQDPLTNTGGMDISGYTGSDVYLGASFATASNGGQVSIVTAPAYTPVGYTVV